MWIFLTAVIKDKHASNNSLQSDFSFQLHNSIMTNTTSKGIEIQLLYAIYIGSSHCSVRLIICDTGGGGGGRVMKFSAIIYYY